MKDLQPIDNSRKSDQFMKTVLSAIHDESIREQLEIFRIGK